MRPSILTRWIAATGNRFGIGRRAGPNRDGQYELPSQRRAAHPNGGRSGALAGRKSRSMLIHALTYLLLSLAGRSAHAAVDAATYLGPVAVIASKDGSRLFVANADAKQVSIVDAADGKLLRSIPMPAPPTGMVLSPDGAAVYVTCAAPRSTVCVLDADSGRVSASIPAGHTAIGPAISPDGARLYVCNRFNNDVSVIDLAERREVARVAVGREPIAAAVTPDGRFIYVASHLPQDRSNASDVAATVSVIEAAGHGTATIRLPNGSTSVRGLCVSPDGQTRVRRACSGALPIACHAAGSRLDEHQCDERHRRFDAASSSARCCWTTWIAARPILGA